MEVPVASSVGVRSFICGNLSDPLWEPVGSLCGNLSDPLWEPVGSSVGTFTEGHFVAFDTTYEDRRAHSK